MPSVERVVKAAQNLKELDEDALETLLGLRARAIEKDKRLQDDPDFMPKYDKAQMGLMDDVQALGRRILVRWSKELHELICGATASDTRERQAILDALHLGEVATIGAVASVLVAIGLYPALAAAVAPLIVKRFIIPAKDELCLSWGELLRAAE
jgi:hypothetical protein